MNIGKESWGMTITEIYVPCIHLDLFHTNNYSGVVSEQGFTKQ